MTRTTIPSPADPAVTDDALAAQPIGYWSGAAHQAVINHIRDAMARLDVTQPQWWTLNRVDSGGEPPTREEVVSHLAEVADGPHDVSRVVDQLLHRGWLDADADGWLGLTDDGRAAKARIKTLVTEVRTEVHDGIADDEYVIALKVLCRMIDNVRRAGATSGG